MNETQTEKAKRFANLVGQRYGRWQVTAHAGESEARKGRHYWLCDCDCGMVGRRVLGETLMDGRSRSCGCLSKELSSRRFRIHGERVNYKPTPEIICYNGAKRRCTNAADPAYPWYGGRGIEFHFTSIEHFISVIGRKPSPEHSLDRIDNDGHYEPGNVRWATQKEQIANRSDNHWITVNGTTLNMADWERRQGLRSGMIAGRIHIGWCESCAVLIPKHRGVCPHVPRRKKRYAGCAAEFIG